MSPPHPQPPRGPAPKKFAGVRRSLYSEVTMDGNFVKMRAGGMLPPICLYTGEPVDHPKVQPEILEFVTSTPTELDKQLGYQAETASIRVFYSPHIKRLFHLQQKYFMAILGVAMVGIPICIMIVDDGRTIWDLRGTEWIPVIAWAACLLGLVIARSRVPQKLQQEFRGYTPGIVHYEHGNVWLAVSPDIAHKLVTYFDPKP